MNHRLPTLIALLCLLASMATSPQIVSIHAQGSRPTLTTTEIPTVSPIPTTVEPSITPFPEPTVAPTANPAPQQAATLRLEITKTLLGSDLIQVGQYITFTIRIRNTGSITITTLPLIDEYDASVLQPTLSRFQPAPDTSATGRLDWADLTDLPGFGDLAPGNEFLVTTVFRAVGISDTVINRARVEAAVGSGGEGGAPIEGGDGGSVEGGRVTIEKTLPEQVIRADAPAVTFVITVRNDGAADLVSVPVEDIFDPMFLRFIEASPAPNRSDPTTGLLRWDNMLGSLGIARLQPGQVITTTTTFAILAPIDNLVVNRVGGVEVRDEFGNAVQAPRQADVRIRIVGVADTRPTATPQAEQPRRERTATPTEATSVTQTVLDVSATPQAEATASIEQTTTATVVSAAQAPTALPNTAAGTANPGILLWFGALCLVIAIAARRRAT